MCTKPKKTDYNKVRVIKKNLVYIIGLAPNIAKKEVIVHGKAFVAEVSIEDQRHYAEDAGKSKEALIAIIEVEKTLSFEADGVLLIE